MPKWVAVQCDHDELRLLLAETRGATAVPRAVETCRFARNDDEAAGLPAQRVARDRVVRLGAAGKAALVVLRRSDVELLTLRMPPASDAELAAMVPHQALRQLSSISDNTVVDFLPLDTDPTQPRMVLVAAAPVERVREWVQRLKQAGLKTAQIGLRNLHVWRLVIRRCLPAKACYLIVHPVAEEVDLTVVVDHQPVLLRSLRLPAGNDHESRHERIIAEGRRSLLAGLPEQLSTITIEAVYVVGSSERVGGLAERLRAQLQVDTHICDPWQDVQGRLPSTPEDREAFSALWAAVEERVAGQATPLDLLHPRRPPRRLGRRRAAALAAICLLAVMASGWYFVAGQLAQMDAALQILDQRRRDLEQTLKKSEKQQQLTGEIGAWQAAAINWLDELRDLSLRLPAQHELILQRLNLTPARGRGGAIDMQGQVRDPATVVELEKRLRDPFHEVRSKKVQQRDGGDAFTWYFETAIAIRPRTPEEYRQSAPALARRP